MDAAANLQPTPPGDGLSQARDLLLLASEELRGPLTSVSGYLQVLLDGEVGGLDPGQERVAEIAARNAGRMERLLDSLIVVQTWIYTNLASQRDAIDAVEKAMEAAP